MRENILLKDIKELKPLSPRMKTKIKILVPYDSFQSNWTFSVGFCKTILCKTLGFPKYITSL